MTEQQVDRIAHKYVKTLGAHTIERNAKCRLCHVKWMLYEIIRWPVNEELGKKFRWLGFIQGVLWVEGVYTIDEMREHNRS